MKKLIFILLMVVLTVSLLFIGCAKQAAPSATTTPATAKPATSATTATLTPQTGGTLKFIMTEVAQGTIGVPDNARGISFYRIIPNEALLIPVLDGSYRPKLATSYEWSNNNKTVTFHLRQGVKFHDGTEFNADAVKWSWDLAVANKAVGADNLVSTEVVDKYTFRANIKEYSNTWLRYLGDRLIVSPTAYQKLGAAYMDWHPVGTGPWKFVSYTENAEMNFERFNDYWGQKAYPDALKILIIADKVTARIALEAKQADYMWVVSGGAQVAHDLEGKGLDIQSAPGMLKTLVPSSGLPGSPLANQKVREAIEYAIDKAKICETLGFKYWEPRYQDVMSPQGPYIAGYKGRTYDPAKAKQLLAEAGYPNGFKTKVWEATQLAGDELPAIQAYLKAVGIDCETEIVSTAKWTEWETQGLPEGLDIGPHSSVYYGYYLERYYRQAKGPGTTPYYNKTVYIPDALDKLVKEYLAIPDTNFDQLVAKGREVAKYYTDNAIEIPLWEQPEIWAAQPWAHDVGGAKWGKLVRPGLWGYNEAWLSSH